MRTVLLSSLILLLAVNNCLSQAMPRKMTAPVAGRVIMKNAPQDKYDARVYSTQMPDPDEGGDEKKLEEVKKLSKQRFPYKKTNASAARTTGIAQPVILNSFVTDTVSGIPPDNSLAVSPEGKGVSVINDNITVFNPETGSNIYRTSLYNFSHSVGLNVTIGDAGNYRYDPKIFYDPTADRFISVMLNGINDHNWIVVGFSATNDPDSAWTFYKFLGNYANDTTWFDYPGVAITQNELFFTGNKVFYDSSWQGGFRRSVIYQVRKQDGYDGDTALHYQLWDSVAYNGQYIRNLFPVNSGSAIEGPSEYFISNRDFDVLNDSVFLIKIPDTIGSTDNILTVTALTADQQYGVPPNGRQYNDTIELATNDGRVLGAYRQGSDIEFVSTTVATGSGASGIYVGKIANYATTPTVTAKVFSIDTLDFGYPNISYTGNVSGMNNSIITFNFTGTHEYPGFGAISYDGTSFSDLLKVRTGDSIIRVLGSPDGVGFASVQRWGDYSGSQPDRVHSGAVWAEGIYGRKHFGYGNYIALLGSPFYTAVPQVQGVSAEAGTLYPNPASQFIRFEFMVPKDEMVSFIIYDMQGKMVDKITDSYCTEGKNVIQFNTSSLPSGNYILKATSSNNAPIAVHQFTRQ